MANKKHPALIGLLVGLVLAAMTLTSCVQKRTVTKDGRTIKSNYVVKRPVTNFFKNVEVE